MTTLTVARPRRVLLSRTSAFWLEASIVVFLLAGSSAPTPLYSVYQGEWGFSPVTTTVVFGVYALAVLVSLLTVGSVSDHLGRRPVLLAALGVQAVTMLIFASASGVPELMVARVLQGLSTGAAVGALGAGLLDLDRGRGTLANAVAPMTGTATGALGSALLIQFLPAPTHLVYLALFAVFAAQAVGVAVMPETVTPKPGVWATLRPRLAVPARLRGPVLAAAPVLVAVWALAGLYGSLGPALVRVVTGSHSYVLGGLALFTLAGSGAAAVFVLRNAAPRAVMRIGIVALLTGVAITMVALTDRSALLLFGGAILAGVGFGGGFQGALRTVVPLAEPHERAGVLSTLFVVSYLAMGLPAVVAGLMVVHGVGIVGAARDYSAAVIVLAALALLGSRRRAR